MIGDKLRRIAAVMDEIASTKIETNPRDGSATRRWCYEQECKLLQAGATRAYVRGFHDNVLIDIDVRTP